MRIQPDALVAGFPAKQIRELLRQSDEFLSRHDATKILGLNGKKAEHLLERLEQEGFIVTNAAVPASAAEHYWKRTIKGSALRRCILDGKRQVCKSHFKSGDLWHHRPGCLE